jgi:hypothetical protein
MFDRQRSIVRAIALSVSLAAATTAGAQTTGVEPTSLVEPMLPQAQIVWRVENPFRFFADPADTEVHRATFQALSPEERLTPILSAERQLARRHPDGWAAAMTGPTCWVQPEEPLRVPRRQGPVRHAEKPCGGRLG